MSGWLSDGAEAAVNAHSFAVDAAGSGFWRGMVRGVGRRTVRAMARAGRSAMKDVRRRFGALHLRHSWRDIEITGRVRVQECAECRRTRVRVY